MSTDYLFGMDIWNEQKNKKLKTFTFSSRGCCCCCCYSSCQVHVVDNDDEVADDVADDDGGGTFSFNINFF